MIVVRLLIDIFIVIGAIDVVVCLYLVLSHTLSDILGGKREVRKEESSYAAQFE